MYNFFLIYGAIQGKKMFSFMRGRAKLPSAQLSTTISVYPKVRNCLYTESGKQPVQMVFVKALASIVCASTTLGSIGVGLAKYEDEKELSKAQSTVCKAGK
jgi:hypothetical protein